MNLDEIIVSEDLVLNVLVVPEDYFPVGDVVNRFRKWIGMGGAGSGHKGHKGVKGQKGGSAPGGSRSATDPFPSNKISSASRLGLKSANECYIVEYEDGTKGIFKPKVGQQFGDVEGEALAYQLSNELGWDIVPYTEMTSYRKVEGSVQRWVDNSKTLAEKGKEVDDVLDPRMDIFDRLLGNDDRHSGNVLEDSSGKQWAIDNGGAFGFGWEHEQTYLSPDKWDFEYFRNSSDAPAYRAATRDLLAWGQSGKKDQYVEKVRTTFGDSTARRFNENYNLLVNWGAYD